MKKQRALKIPAALTQFATLSWLSPLQHPFAVYLLPIIYWFLFLSDPKELPDLEKPFSARWSRLVLSSILQGGCFYFAAFTLRHIIIVSGFRFFLLLLFGSLLLFGLLSRRMLLAGKFILVLLSLIFACQGFLIQAHFILSTLSFWFIYKNKPKLEAEV